MMEKILDRPVPQHMIRRSRTKYFDSQTLKLLWDANSSEAKYTNQNCRPLHQYQRYEPTSSLGKEEISMYDLILQMLEYDPTARVMLRSALRHKFFDKLFCQEKLLHTSNHILKLRI